jgi:uridylate kinase
VKKECVVISVSGSLLVPDKIDSQFLKDFVTLIQAHSEKQFVLVVGGGRPARAAQEAVRSVREASVTDRDWLGIMATRMNAELLRVAFGARAHKHVVIDPTKPLPNKPVIVAAGWKPGWSSDYVAVLLAKKLKAHTLINLTYTDYVYDKDPRKYPDAKPFEKLSWKAFLTIVGSKRTPNMNAPFDPVGAKLAKQARIRVIIVNGQKLNTLQACIEGRPFTGTVIEDKKAAI